MARWPITFQSSPSLHARGVPLDEGQDQAAVVVQRADPDPAGRDRAGAVVLPALQAQARAGPFPQPGLQVLGVLAAPLGQAVAQPRARQHVREQPLLLRRRSRGSASTSTNRKCTCGTWAMAGSTAAMVRITSASTTGDRSGPKWAAGTVMPEQPAGVQGGQLGVGHRARPVALDHAAGDRLGVGPGGRERFRCGEEDLSLRGGRGDAHRAPARTGPGRPSGPRPGRAPRPGPGRPPPRARGRSGSTSRPNRSISSW